METKQRPRGQLQIGFSIYCGKCTVSSQSFPHLRIRNRADVLTSVRKDGWKKTSRHGWICYLCAEESNPQKKATQSSAEDAPF